MNVLATALNEITQKHNIPRLKLTKFKKTTILVQNGNELDQCKQSVKLG